MPTANELVHYPSCVVNLQLTVDPKLYIRVEDGGAPENQNLVRSPNNGAFILNRVPKKCNIQLQGYTQAATYKLVFDYRELPIDPRTIVAATAEIYLGTVSASDFADGMNREVAPGIRKSILRTRNQDGTLNEEFLVMLGPVDDWSVKHNEGASEVHLEGRDLRGIFLDSPLVSEFDVAQNRNQPTTTPRPGHTAATPNRRRRTHILDRLVTDVPINKVVEQLIYQHDTIRRLPENLRPRVLVNPAEWLDGIVPSPGKGSHIPRHRRGANGQGGGGGGAAANMNFWDAITRYCYLVGAIPTFRGRNLLIRPGYALFDRIRNIETPFVPNQSRTNGLDTWHIRRLVWGRDIENLELGRKYAGHNKPKTVRCISVDPSAGTNRRGREQRLEASWPPRTVREARREGAKDPRNAVGGEESQEIMNIPVHGVRNIQQLTDIARSFYEQLGRLEMKGSVSTSKLTSFGGTNADPDLLRLRVGDPVELLVDASRLEAQSPIVSTLNQSAQLPFSEAVRQVQRYIPDENLCRAIVASAWGNIMGVLRYFRVGSVDFDWSYESVEVKADIQNYFTPRWDRNESERQAAARSQHPVDHHRGQRANRALADVSAGGEEITLEPTYISRNAEVEVPLTEVVGRRSFATANDVMQSPSDVVINTAEGYVTQLFREAGSRW
jgi:hypothetical protein